MFPGGSVAVYTHRRTQPYSLYVHELLPTKHRRYATQCIRHDVTPAYRNIHPTRILSEIGRVVTSRARVLQCKGGIGVVW